MCEEGWRFVVVDISVHCLVPPGSLRSFIASGLIASRGFRGCLTQLWGFAIGDLKRTHFKMRLQRLDV